MPKVRILVADNDKAYREGLAEFLERAGYRVVQAGDPGEAHHILESGRVDLAVLDIRLRDDADKKDWSGLQIAREAAPAIPKIILTKFPSRQTMRQALGPEVDKRSLAVDYLDKDESESLEDLLAAIRRWTGPRQMQEIINGTKIQLTQSYQDARAQARLNHGVALGVATMGFVLIFIGIALALWQQAQVTLVSAGSGVITELVSLLFFNRVDKANQRMDRYRADLLEMEHFEALLATCDQLPVGDKQTETRMELIRWASERWLAAPAAHK